MFCLRNQRRIERCNKSYPYLAKCKSGDSILTSLSIVLKVQQSGNQCDIEDSRNETMKKRRNIRKKLVEGC